MSEEDVGIEQFGGDPLLAGVDDFMAWRGCGQQFQVTGLNGIARYDSHTADGSTNRPFATANPGPPADEGGRTSEPTR
jgi:hypothetical protein